MESTKFLGVTLSWKHNHNRSHNHNKTMAAKTQSPSTKLSPAERLARKRAAARLRQQRCRARKRQAMLEQQRSQDKKMPKAARPQDTRIDLTKRAGESHKPSFPISFPKEIMSSPTREPIYNVVSFESPRSSEEAMRGQRRSTAVSRSSSEQSFSGSPSSPSSTGKPVEVISFPKNQQDEPLVAQEEAAIAAMLSLKSGSLTETTPPSTPPRPEGPKSRVASGPPPAPMKHRYYRDWDAPSYGYGRQGRRPGPPPYYGMAMPRPIAPPPAQFRYYERKGYSRFDYD